MPAMRTGIYFLFLTFCTSSFAVSPECLQKLETNLEELHDQQTADYRLIDPEEGDIRPGNQARFLPGTTDEAVIVIHGFAASPFEVEELGKALNWRGATVYLALLPGFGASAKVANRYRRESWRAALDSYVGKFSRCFSEVSLAGFSTGGTTVTDLLLENRSPIRIKRAALLSPYLESASEFTDALNAAVSLFSGSVPVQFLYDISHNADLEAILANPNFYNQDLPLHAAKQVIAYGSAVRRYAQSANPKSDVPVLVAFSLADKTIEAKDLQPFYREHFHSAQFNIYPESLGVPHQIAVPNANPYARALIERVTDFLFNQEI